MGLGVFLLKNALSGFSLSLLSLPMLLLNPVIVLAAALSVSGFMIVQKSMYGGHISVVSPIVVGIGIALPIALACIVLAEPLSLADAAGISLIVAGIVFLGAKS